MDTRMLDVVIGLVMVFAVSSLLATAVQEAIASWRNSRGENLKRAIASMGGDDERVVDELYKEPLVQSLFLSSRGGPSYLSADVFSTALFSLLSKSTSVPMRQGTPLEFLSSIAVQPGTPAGYSALLDTLKTLAAGVEHDWPAFESRVQAWYAQAGERSIGWFKRDTQLNLFIIGMTMAVVMNVDAIHIGNALWSDPALRERSVEMARRLSNEYAATTATTSTPAAPTPLRPESAAAAAPTPNPMIAAQAATDEQFKKLKEGLSELRKQKGLLGTTGDLQLTASSRLTSSIADERRMRALPKPDPNELARIENQNDENARLLIGGFSTDALAKVSQADKDALRNLRESADKAAAFLRTERASMPAATTPKEETIASASKAAPCSGLSSKAEKECKSSCANMTGNELNICTSTVFLNSLNDAGIPIGWDDGQLGRLAAGGLALWLPTLLGWLITAMAVTLGAPFWFDLLGKLVKLRGAGGKAESPEADKAAGAQSITTTPPATPLSPSGEPFSDALNDAEKQLTAPEIQSIQMRLGMRNEQISGRIDGETRSAIRDWQGRQGFANTGILTPTEIYNLRHPGVSTVNEQTSHSDPDNTIYEG